MLVNDERLVNKKMFVANERTKEVKMLKVVRLKLQALIEGYKKRHETKGKKVSLRSIAKALGISHVALWEMMNKEGYNPSLSMLDRLCTFFKCQPQDLLEYKKD